MTLCNKCNVEINEDGVCPHCEMAMKAPEEPVIVISKEKEVKKKEKSDWEERYYE